MIEQTLVTDAGRGGYELVGASAGVAGKDAAFLRDAPGVSDALHLTENRRVVHLSFFQLPSGRWALTRRFIDGRRENRGGVNRIVAHSLLLDDAVMSALAFEPGLLTSEVSYRWPAETDRQMLAELGPYLAELCSSLPPDSRSARELEPLTAEIPADAQEAAYTRVERRLAFLSKELGDALPGVLAWMIETLVAGQRIALSEDPVHEQLLLLTWSILPVEDRLAAAWTTHFAPGVPVAFRLAISPQPQQIARSHREPREWARFGEALAEPSRAALEFAEQFIAQPRVQIESIQTAVERYAMTWIGQRARWKSWLASQRSGPEFENEGADSLDSLQHVLKELCHGALDEYSWLSTSAFLKGLARSVMKISEQAASKSTTPLRSQPSELIVGSAINPHVLADVAHAVADCTDAAEQLSTERWLNALGELGGEAAQLQHAAFAFLMQWAYEQKQPELAQSLFERDTLAAGQLGQQLLAQDSQNLLAARLLVHVAVHLDRGTGKTLAAYRKRLHAFPWTAASAERVLPVALSAAKRTEDSGSHLATLTQTVLVKLKGIPPHTDSALSSLMETIPPGKVLTWEPVLLAGIDQLEPSNPSECEALARSWWDRLLAKRPLRIPAHSKAWLLGKTPGPAALGFVRAAEHAVPGLTLAEEAQFVLGHAVRLAPAGQLRDRLTVAALQRAIRNSQISLTDFYNEVERLRSHGVLPQHPWTQVMATPLAGDVRTQLRKVARLAIDPDLMPAARDCVVDELLKPALRDTPLADWKGALPAMKRLAERAALLRVVSAVAGQLAADDLPAADAFFEQLLDTRDVVAIHQFLSEKETWSKEHLGDQIKRLQANGQSKALRRLRDYFKRVKQPEPQALTRAMEALKRERTVPVSELRGSIVRKFLQGLSSRD